MGKFPTPLSSSFPSFFSGIFLPVRKDLFELLGFFFSGRQGRVQFPSQHFGVPLSHSLPPPFFSSDFPFFIFHPRLGGGA